VAALSLARLLQLLREAAADLVEDQADQGLVRLMSEGGMTR
jgi:hypothetical protein